MPAASTMEEKIAEVVARTLNIEVPAIDTDLVAMGVIDSLSLISIVMSLQQELGIEIDLGNIELDNFRSVRSIAQHTAT